MRDSVQLYCQKSGSGMPAGVRSVQRVAKHPCNFRMLRIAVRVCGWYRCESLFGLSTRHRCRGLLGTSESCGVDEVANPRFAQTIPVTDTVVILRLVTMEALSALHHSCDGCHRSLHSPSQVSGTTFTVHITVNSKRQTNFSVVTLPEG